MDRRSYLQTLSLGLASLSGCSRLAGSERPPSAVAPETMTPTATETTTITAERAPVRIETVTMNLEVPWGGSFHPETGSLYLTERPGRIRRITPGTGEHDLVGGEAELVTDLSDEIAQEITGGLLGIVFHPNDPEFAYTYGTYEIHDGVENRIVRHDVENDFAVESVVLGEIPAASINNGGRLAVGPDGALYATVGDAGDPTRAQATDSPVGSVLRLTPDGDPHPRNPSGTAVFTTGHRNPLGMAFHPETGALFCTDRGAGQDELNELEAGGNYGWGATEEKRETHAESLVTYDPPIALAGATFYDGPIDEWDGDCILGALSGRHLRRVTLDSKGATVRDQHALLTEEYGRLRTVILGPDEHLYVMTSNRDRHGTPAPQDDRILRIRPA